jgi:hypothetical protein
MKKLISMALCLIMVLAVFAVPALASGETFEYELIYTDANGNQVTDLSKLNVGDTLNVKLMLYRTDDNEDYAAYGIEMALITKGLSYNNDGKPFDGSMSVSSTTQKVAGTQTLNFVYMDLSKEGMYVPATQQIGTCSYKVTSKDVSVSFAVGLVYLVGSDTAYTIAPKTDGCKHTNNKTTYTSNNNGTHVVKVVCEDCSETVEDFKENCTYTGKVTKEPTCEEKGVKTYTCQYCGHTYTEKLDAAGHTWDEGKVTKEPTTTEEGIKSFTCTVCSATKTEPIDKLSVDPEKPDDTKDDTKTDDKKTDDKKTDDTTKKDDQSKNDKTTDNTASKTQASTGDTGMIAIYAAVAAIAVAGFGFIIVMKKKRA